MATSPVQLSSVAPVLLPPTITDPIFKKASEDSAVMRLARRIPLSVNAVTQIPVPMDIPTAGWVSEGGPKPVAAGGVGVKTMTGKKVALLVPVSEEVVRTNAGGLYDQLVQDLPTAIGRAFDYAAIHGLDLKTGAAGPFQDFLAVTPNSQVIGSTAASAGGVYADLWKGIQQVENVPGYEFTGFAADRRLRSEVALSTDIQGRPLLVDAYPNANSTLGYNENLVGVPVAYNSGVSGAYYRQGNLVQAASINGTPTGGTFTVTVGGSTTAPIAYNAVGATVQTAVQALGGVASNVSVTGSAGGPYTFTNSQVGAQITVNQKALTGGTAPASQATVAQSPVLDSGLRAIGGDWSQCAYGVGMDITIKQSAEASYSPDGGTTWISSFQANLILLLVEAYYGFVVGDPKAYVAYTHAVGS